MSNTVNERFEALDAFRGLAAIFVVIFHMHLVGSVTELNFFKGSSIFVEFFFVLSGFVLTHGYGFKKNLKFSSFIKSRFFRLYPLHLFMLLFFILLEVCKFIAYEYNGITFNNIPFSGTTDFSEIIPNLLLIQSWVPIFDSFSFNAPSWSISIEFYLYILLFFTIIIFSKFKKYIWIAITIMTFYWMLTESEMVVTPILRGLSCFFGGALTYLIYKKIVPNIQLGILLGTIIEVAILASVVMVVQSSFKYQNIAATILFYTVVLVFSFESGVVSNLLKFRSFQVLGKLSYSIYMTHVGIYFCVYSTMIVLQKFTAVELVTTRNDIRYLSLGGEFLNNFFVLVILTIVIFTSHITYKHIELKGQKIGKRTNFMSI